VYFGKKHQRKVERGGLKRQKKNEHSNNKNREAIFQCHGEKYPIKIDN
jgi:hypothetical protein